jgi:hypothetical protein
MEAAFNEFKDTINQRLSAIEDKLKDTSQESVEPEEEGDPGGDGANNQSESGPPMPGHVAPQSHHVLNTGSAGRLDIQGDFQVLKESLARLKLPQDLRVNESRQGIQRQDHTVYNIVAKCARYAETSVKLLTTIQPDSPISQKTLEDLFLINHAQIKYLQDEYASILVNSQFDSSTSKIFRALQKNTAGLGADSLETLRSAAALAAVARPQQQRQTTGRGRGQRQYGGYNNSNYNKQDVFSSFAQKQFPAKRQFYNKSKEEIDKDD